MQAKITIQLVDTEAPFINTSIVEIDEIPMDDNVHQNLVQFLLELKQPTKAANEPEAIITGAK